jgi:sugar lactone lactonase YvrE
LKYFLLLLLGVTLAAAITLRVRYGGGEPYEDISTPPLLNTSELEVVLSYPEPIGNVAVSPEGRIFFTVHPESRPQGNRLLEWRDGAAVPYPDGTGQPRLFNTVLGLAIDRHDRLWTISNGNHGFDTARLLAFDLNNGDLVHSHEFANDIAPAGSFLQDLQVSPDGLTVYIADASLWRQRPAIVVYDVGTRASRRVLEMHESVSAEPLLIRTSQKDMAFLGGLVTLRAGVDGIALDTDGEWLYIAAMNNGYLFRVRTEFLNDATLPERQLSSMVERFSAKPLSDGLSADLAGNIYVTDIEHNSVFVVKPDRTGNTLIQSTTVRWPDALSFGPDGWLYLADSAIPDQVLQSQEHIRQQGPYQIFRFRPGFDGVPGH